MIDDLASLKAATIERFVSRARVANDRGPHTSAADQPPWDAAFLINPRACKATLDASQSLIHCERLGARQSSCKVLMIVPTLPAAPSAGDYAFRVRTHTQERGSHQQNPI